MKPVSILNHDMCTKTPPRILHCNPLPCSTCLSAKIELAVRLELWRVFVNVSAEISSAQRPRNTQEITIFLIAVHECCMWTCETLSYCVNVPVRNCGAMLVGGGMCMRGIAARWAFAGVCLSAHACACMCVHACACMLRNDKQDRIDRPWSPTTSMLYMSSSSC